MAARLLATELPASPVPMSEKLRKAAWIETGTLMEITPEARLAILHFVPL